MWGAGLDIAKKNSRVTKEGKPVIKSQTRKLFDFQSPNIRDGATASTKALGPTHFNPLADGRIKMGKQLFVELKLHHVEPRRAAAPRPYLHPEAGPGLKHRPGVWQAERRPAVQGGGQLGWRALEVAGARQR